MPPGTDAGVRARWQLAVLECEHDAAGVSRTQLEAQHRGPCTLTPAVFAVRNFCRPLLADPGICERSRLNGRSLPQYNVTALSPQGNGSVCGCAFEPRYEAVRRLGPAQPRVLRVNPRLKPGGMTVDLDNLATEASALAWVVESVSPALKTWRRMPRE